MSAVDWMNAIVATVFTAQVALGLMVVFGVMKIINMAHGEFFMLGAFVMVVVDRLGVDLWLGILLAPLVLGAVGAAIERGIIRRLYVRRDLSTLLVTFGLSIVLQQLIRLIFGPQSLSVGSPIEGSLAIFGTQYPSYRLVAAGISVAVTVAIAYAMYRTSWGIRVRATAESSSTASALGVNTGRMFSSTFAVGAGLAGLAGALMAPFVGVNALMGLEQTVRSFLVVITGGMGSIGGTVGGSVIIGGGQSVAGVWLSGSATQLLVLGIAMLTILLRPQGLFSRKTRIA
ncbi:MAG: branched-chain amino acid ABC transporter permease [Candidatus Leucobacter sulfamidivorax]|nr:branched-chain amino acid ABC transporter permease [Candidatus Leucobacter sulfamidivorax]